MDFTKLDVTTSANAGAVMQVTHPSTGDELEGTTITLLGQDSDIYQKEIKKRAEQSLNNRNGRNKKVDLDEAKIKGAELLARLTTAWTGIAEGKTELECNFDNCVKMYLKYPWLREQVEAFITDRGNFIKV